MVPYGGDKVVENRKVAIVGALVSRQFPDTFHRIEVWTVRRKKIELQRVPMVVQPRLELSCVVPTRVVHDHEHFAAVTTMAQELSQKEREGRGIERVGLAGHKASVLDAHGAKQGHALAGGCVQDHGIDILGRYPHRTS